MKIVTIVGARPQFIKYACIYNDLRKEHDEILVHTGQHYDYEMSKIFFDELDIPAPEYNLEVGSYTHGKQTALMLERIEKVLLKEKADIVLVYGDTNSTLAGALAAVKLSMLVAHIEAGLRSYRLDMPEEVNRVLTDRISKFLFCPTKTAVKNLKNEGMVKGVYLVGDVMYDAFLDSQKLLSKRKILSKLELKPKGYLLLTIHRQENTDNFKNLKSILSALIKAEEKIVFPSHPRTKKALKKIEGFKLKNFLPIKPVSYLDMLVLEKNARKILTDSGGVQKEAYWLGTPCITLRNETEWVETVEDKWNILTGAKSDKIINAIKNFNPSEKQRKIFGNGKASLKIARLMR
ncbi:UDP-N-acetylglucosamine 2-epimerase (non-hydrolyzing) [Candidatus Babeliales bacterium]|nr:UDP-N-acetylglucosamine 2-epimerase (non-hydrolyzing) [Candidatus Babeliales bacterium]